MAGCFYVIFYTLFYTGQSMNNNNNKYRFVNVYVLTNLYLLFQFFRLNVFETKTNYHIRVCSQWLFQNFANRKKRNPQ